MADHSPDEATDRAIARIDRALRRLEGTAANTSAVTPGDSRYQALRTRTQAALASLETVIAQAGGRS